MTQPGDQWGIDGFLSEFDRFKITSSSRRNAHLGIDEASTPRYDGYYEAGYGAADACYDERFEPTYDFDVEQAAPASMSSHYALSAASGPSSRSLYQQSVFSAPAAASTTTTRRTTPPPSRGAGLTMEEWIQETPMPAPVESPYHPCEFCDATFAETATQKWVQHVTKRHMRDCFPPRAGCVYCPETFEAESKTDRKANFLRRMSHIQGHLSESLCGEEARSFMGPDWYLITYMREKGIFKDAETTRLLNEFIPRPKDLRPRGTSTRTSSARKLHAVEIQVENAGRHRRSRK